MRSVQKSFALLALVAGTALTAGLQFCVKPPNYPTEPVIKFVSLTPGTSLQKVFFKNMDSLAVSVTFSYTDGDGDLGFPKSDMVSDITVFDTRVPNFPRQYSLPYIDEQGAGNGISGDITIRLPVTCCIPPPLNGIPLPACDSLSPSNQLRDTMTYTIQIKDRAGHLSNVIETSPFILICRRQ